LFTAIKKKLKALLGVPPSQESKKSPRKQEFASIPIPPRVEFSAKESVPDQAQQHRKRSSKPRTEEAAPSQPRRAPRSEDGPSRSRRPASVEDSPAHARHVPASSHAQPTPLVLPELIESPVEEGQTRFTDLPIAKEVLCGVQDLGFLYCTPIQAQCLPLALDGRDVTGKAQTGTGKTAAFLIAIFTKLLAHRKAKYAPGFCRTLILAPTRELAIQIHDDAVAIGKYTGLNILAVYGGMGHQTQRNALQQHIDILVGTPGRIIDFYRSGHLHLTAAEFLVIDEADRMLDMGFIPDVRRIVSQLPEPGKRQTMFFSATLTPEITRLVDKWLVNPAEVEIEAETIVTDLIDQRFYSVSVDSKSALLIWLLKNEPITRALIFTNRKDSAERLCNLINRHGVGCELLSGDVPQQKRLKVLETFRSGKTPVIVATDVAARGIHVDDISHVLNYDLPEQPEDYVHRIGRTGRAGKTGVAISFLCEYGSYVIPSIEKFLGKEIHSIMPEEQMLAPLAHMPALPGERREYASSHGGGGGRPGGFRGGSRGGPRPGGRSGGFRPRR